MTLSDAMERTVDGITSMNECKSEAVWSWCYEVIHEIMLCF